MFLPKRITQSIFIRALSLRDARTDRLRKREKKKRVIFQRRERTVEKEVIASACYWKTSNSSKNNKHDDLLSDTHTHTARWDDCVPCAPHPALEADCCGGGAGRKPSESPSRGPS